MLLLCVNIRYSICIGRYWHSAYSLGQIILNHLTPYIYKLTRISVALILGVPDSEVFEMFLNLADSLDPSCEHDLQG